MVGTIITQTHNKPCTNHGQGSRANVYTIKCQSPSPLNGIRTHACTTVRVHPKILRCTQTDQNPKWSTSKSQGSKHNVQPSSTFYEYFVTIPHMPQSYYNWPHHPQKPSVLPKKNSKQFNQLNCQTTQHHFHSRKLQSPHTHHHPKLRTLRT